MPSLPQISWTSLAEANAAELYDYIAADSVAAADRQLDRVLQSISSLQLFPRKGREGRVDGTRELVVPATPYVVAYRLDPEQVWILAILHGARRWPASFPES